jgi:hypothetical protein
MSRKGGLGRTVPSSLRGMIEKETVEWEMDVGKEKRWLRKGRVPKVICNVKLEHIAAWRKRMTMIATGLNPRIYEVGSRYVIKREVIRANHHSITCNHRFALEHRCIGAPVGVCDVRPHLHRV